MSDNTPQVGYLDASSAAEWRAFFAAGETFAVPLDRDAVNRRMRANTTVMVVASAVIVVSLGAGTAIALGTWGRALTFVLLFVLAAVTLIVWVKFFWIRRRLRALTASGDEYLSVDANGIRLAGTVPVAWTDIVGGVGFDDRAVRVALLRRPAARISLAAGESRSEVVLGFRETRALRTAAHPGLRHMFIVGSPPMSGGVRLPLDVALEPDAVLPTLAALWAAGEQAGVDIVLTRDYGLIGRLTTHVLLGKRPTELS
ncbi:hypothetical protein LG315_10145 [Microbacterium marinum]|uniref:hypothetical protein n=1 Tax=Microbacterium marinum TaxID=421115 RepID=UPI00384D7DDB